MTQPGFDFAAEPVSLPPLMMPAGDESEQAITRLRVFETLQAAGTAGLSTPQLIERSRCYAAPRRVWELSKFYGWRIVGEKVKANAWRWTLIGPEPWAKSPLMPWRQAKQLETARLAALGAVNAPTGRVGQDR